METQDHFDMTEENAWFSHKLLLEKPYLLTCIGQLLIELLGYSAEEIRTGFKNQYCLLIHPEDRARYLAFLSRMAEGEKALSMQYRMVSKDGRSIFVSDNMFSHKKQDGRLYGFSVIACIEEPPEPRPDRLVLNGNIPFGYMQCTCDKYPKVLYVNDHMLKFLSVTPDSRDWQEFLHDNIFFMIPFEDRDSFRSYLNSATATSEPIHISHRILNSHGERLSVSGWLSTIIGKTGLCEYSILYTEIQNTGREQITAADNSYFKALQSAYNIIFEINLSLQTVECIYGKETSDLGKLYDARMTVDGAAYFWLNHYIIEEDRDRMRRYFDEICIPGFVQQAERPPQAEFSILWEDQEIYSFIGVTVPLNSSSLLFCCRDTAKVSYSGQSAREVLALRRLNTYANLVTDAQKQVFGAVILCCSESKNSYTLVYASPSVLDCLQLRSDQVLRYTETPFTFADIKKRLPEKLRNITGDHLPEQWTDPDSQRSYRFSVTERIPGYIECVITLDHGSADRKDLIPREGIFARTFGYFDLFVNGVPVVFPGCKEKELLALLIDRRGGTLTSSDAISFLWEDCAADERMKARYRKLAMNLKRTLDAKGIGRIIVNHHGIRCIDTDALTCDYYEMLAGNEQYREMFHNAYMTDYSWADETLATLWQYS